MVGFASYGPNRDEDTEQDSELYAIYLFPAHQGRGVGKMLLKETAKRLSDSGFRAMVVWVLSANPSRLFYEKMGGSEVAERKIEIVVSHLMRQRTVGTISQFSVSSKLQQSR